MRTRTWRARAGIVLALGIPVQDGQKWISQNRSFAIELPVSWRQVTPAELPGLRDVLPPDIHTTRPRDFYTLGPVDRWIAGDYDGVELVVQEQGVELPMDREGVDYILEHWAKVSGNGGLKQEVLSWEFTEVGPDDNPAILCERLIEIEGSGKSIQSLDAYVPTGGRQILLSFRARREDFSTELPRFREMLESATFARAARGSQKLGDKLLLPAVAGAFVGLLLLALRRRRLS